MESRLATFLLPLVATAMLGSGAPAAISGVVNLPELSVPPNGGCAVVVHVDARARGQSVGQSIIAAMRGNNGAFACPYHIANVPTGVPVTVTATFKGSAMRPAGWTGTIVLSSLSMSELNFAPQNAPNAFAGALNIERLSTQQRMSLGSQTKVTIGKVTTTLAALRANHQALVASRERVRSLTGANLRAMLGIDHGFTKSFGPALRPGHFMPTNLSTPMPTTVPRVSTSGFAADYQQFCNSVAATVCLYYPPGVTWWAVTPNGNYQTIDSLITDPNVCAQEGGVLNGGNGCLYTYPSAQSVNFVPPGGGFTTSGWCDLAAGNFSLQTDRHGAVRIADAGASGLVIYSAWGTPVSLAGSSPNLEQFCFVQVSLAH
jgi:hypothetical protein